MKPTQKPAGDAQIPSAEAVPASDGWSQSRPFAPNPCAATHEPGIADDMLAQGVHPLRSKVSAASTTAQECGGGAAAQTVPIARGAVVLLTIALAYWNTSSPAFAGSVAVVQGQLRQTSLEPSGSVRSARAWEYVIQHSAQRWTVRCTEATPVPAGTAWQTEVSGDGRDLYYVVRFRPGQETQGATNGLHANAHVTEGDYPLQAGSPERLLWLAYCSGSYLAAHRSLPSMRDPQAGPLQSLIQTTFRAAGPAGNPAQLKQFSPCLFAYRGTNQEAVRLPAPYEEGWTDFEYDAGESTNVLGSQLPISFAANYYLVDTQSAARRYGATMLTGWVESVEVLPAPAILAQLAEDAQVFDNRFTNHAGLPAMYRDHRGAGWLERDNPGTIKELIRKQPLFPAGTAGPVPRMRWLVLGLLGLAAVLPPTIWVITRRIRARRCAPNP